MAQLTYKTFAEWGTDIFCIEDYKDYLSVNKKTINYNHHLAGMVIFDDDNKETVEGFIDMCVFNKIPLFMIDYSNIKENEELVKYIDTYLKNTAEKTTYINLQSYEFRFSFGLKYTYQK